MGQPRRQEDEPEFNLKEWGLKARIISRENTSSRRYSASYIRNSGEDARSFRSNIAISSTASSPGYTMREEIDPSTYSFTNALKVLQAKKIYSSDYMSPDGLTLNSKWSEAERYICNPLSGEVPLECLSAKALTARSFRQLRRITMSAPLVYPAQQPRQFQMKPAITTLEEDDDVKTTVREKRIGSMTRDVGIQSSTPVAIGSNSPSPASTPSIEERSIKRIEAESEDSFVSTEKVKLEEEGVINGRSEEEDTKRNEGEKKKARKGGCLSWKSLWMKTRQRARKQI